MRAARGQATVELALGSVVFVTLLLVGIHLAEVGALSLKVQEAQTFATWELTGRRVQTRRDDGSTDANPFRRSVDRSTGVGAEALRRYRDFNGLSSEDRAGVVMLAIARGSNLQVDCRANPALGFAPSPTAAAVYFDTGGAQCQSSAQVTAARIPRAFMQKGSGGWFEADPFRRAPIALCGMGLADRGGRCPGQLAILTNDWGLMGDETRTCDLTCRVSKYRGMTQRIFGGGGGAGRAFAQAFAGSAPTDADEFHFSSVDVDSSYTQNLSGEGQTAWQTGGPGVPGGMVFQTRTGAKCFLGRPGCF